MGKDLKEKGEKIPRTAIIPKTKESGKSAGLFLCASGWACSGLCRLSEAKNHDPGPLVKAHKKSLAFARLALQDGLGFEKMKSSEIFRNKKKLIYN